LSSVRVRQLGAGRYDALQVESAARRSHNCHLFSALYQIATAEKLEPEIAKPVQAILRGPELDFRLP
jgi:hypothetical protein